MHESAEPIWRPTPQRMAASNMQRFIASVSERLDRPDYDALYAWSLSRPDEFWEVLWNWCGVRASNGYDTVVCDLDRMPGARWFEGARLNFVDNLLRPEHDAAALAWVNERGDRETLERAELAAQVAAVADALTALGVRPGDRVAGLLPNRPETVVAMLAAASIGAIWSACSPDFGVDGVLDRLGQIDPKILFATDGYFYNGKTIDSLPTVAALAGRLAGLTALVIVPYRGARDATTGLPRALAWSDLVAAARHAPTARPACVPLPFDHPLYILYSSGTTGVPKGIVHGAGGTLLQHLKEHALHCDIRAGDRVFYFTTCGWMMWHWLVSTLACGATAVLYEGAPFHPDPGVLWRMAEREAVNVFGTSARYLAALEKSEYRPREHVDLAPLASILSTGSPLAPASFDYVYRDVKPDVHLASISGGTDIISCFALGNPLRPVWRGELQGPGLGMRVAVFDRDGRSVRERKGELVCSAPFPSMPVSFWNDPDGAKYHKAYFTRFPGVWHHGDWAEFTAHDGVIIHGRSDAVLNPGGVRIGTGEIYRVIERFAEIEESIAVGQDWEGDTRIVLFVRLKPGISLDKALRTRIALAIREAASPRHVPAKIIAVPDIPRTLNGKLVELAVRETIAGREVVNADALANPEALDYFRDLEELRT
jgi:acetoacetyl-CoA synthetase